MYVVTSEQEGEKDGCDLFVVELSQWFEIWVSCCRDMSGILNYLFSNEATFELLSIIAVKKKTLDSETSFVEIYDFYLWGKTLTPKLISRVKVSMHSHVNSFCDGKHRKHSKLFTQKRAPTSLMCQAGWGLEWKQLSEWHEGSPQVRHRDEYCSKSAKAIRKPFDLLTCSCDHKISDITITLLDVRSDACDMCSVKMSMKLRANKSTACRSDPKSFIEILKMKCWDNLWFNRAIWFVVSESFNERNGKRASEKR